MEWSCIHFLDMDYLTLKVSWGDPYEDGCEHEVEVSVCPFCGYKPSHKVTDRTTQPT